MKDILHLHKNCSSHCAQLLVLAKLIASFILSLSSLNCSVGLLLFPIATARGRYFQSYWAAPIVSKQLPLFWLHKVFTAVTASEPQPSPFIRNACKTVGNLLNLDFKSHPTNTFGFFTCTGLSRLFPCLWIISGLQFVTVEGLRVETEGSHYAEYCPNKSLRTSGKTFLSFLNKLLLCCHPQLTLHKLLPFSGISN